MIKTAQLWSNRLDFLYKIVDSTSNFSNTSTSCFNWTISVEQQEHDHHFCFVSIDCLSLNSSSIRQIPKRLPRFITELPLLFGIRFITQFEDSSISLEYNSFSIELHGYVLWFNIRKDWYEQWNEFRRWWLSVESMQPSKCNIDSKLVIVKVNWVLVLVEYSDWTKTIVC